MKSCVYEYLINEWYVSFIHWVSDFRASNNFNHRDTSTRTPPTCSQANSNFCFCFCFSWTFKSQGKGHLFFSFLSQKVYIYNNKFRKTTRLLHQRDIRFSIKSLNFFLTSYIFYTFIYLLKYKRFSQSLKFLK